MGVFIMDKSIGDRLKSLRDKYGYKQYFIAQKIGVESNTLSGYESGARMPNPIILSKLAEIYGVSTDYLIYGHEKPSNQLDYDLSKEAKVPLAGTIRAGEPIDRLENVEGYISVDPRLTEGNEVFALRVTGESMSGDEIHDGDIVVVVKQNECDSSEIAVVAVDNDYATLKRVKRIGNTVMLIPSNPTMQPFIKNISEISIIGVVEEIRKKPRNRK